MISTPKLRGNIVPPSQSLGAKGIFSTGVKSPKAYVDGEITITATIPEPRSPATSTFCATPFVAWFFVAADTAFVELPTIGNVN
ncbi:hypothetical protein N9Y42_00060 [Mariniblastus sp.]|nr:hypothetical protein [Mariniblastus sp.]